MKTGAKHTIEESGTRGTLRLAVVVALTAALSLSWAAGIATAGDRHHGDSESRIYGAIETLPQDRVGAWVVNGREIVVTKDTRIEEKHGKAEAGAFVKVEGNTTGRTFIADEVEVKQAKQSDR